MTLFTSLLFTIHVISSIVESLLDVQCPNKCQPNEPNQEIHCVKIEELRGQVAYTPMLACAMIEFKCHAGEEAILSSVEMSKCYPKWPKRVKREDPLPDNVLEDDPFKVTEPWKPESIKSHKEECPNECPTSSRMVCARCNHGIYRSFLSDCHMRMYQCGHPDEKLELVSRHSCYGSAPYLMDDNKAQDDKEALHDMDTNKGVTKKTRLALAGVLHESDFWTPPHPKPRTPKPTVHVTWPSRRTRTKSATGTMSRLPSKPLTKRPTTPRRTTPTSSTTSLTSTTMEVTTTDTSQSNEDNEDVERIDVDICPNDEDQETAIEVPDVCTNTTINSIYSGDYMKVDLHPDFIEDGAPVWMVFNGGKKITSKLRTDAGLVVGCDAYAGLDFSGNVVVRNKNDNDFLGFVFGYRSNSQFYLVSWKAKSDKYWLGWPSVVKADAGLHIKLVNSATGPGAYLRNALYSTESVKDQVKLLWQDPNKQGWKHLVLYSWQLLHRPHIGLIRVKVFRGGKLIVDSGNVYDKTIKGGRIGVYAFSQENIEWHRMKFECNDKIPKNLMSELPPDLQKISVVDQAYTWSNISGHNKTTETI